MNFLQLYIDAFKRILDIKGKSTRTAFWSFAVITAIVSYLLTAFLPIVAGIYGIVSLVASITLFIRRARDTGYTPFLALTMLIPIVGLLVLGLLPSRK